MRFAISLVFISLFPMANFQSAEAQDLLKTLRDYHFEKPLQYSAEDPWTRSRLFRWHTGHAGFFYNCDCQEEKRNSPYICWKTTCQNSLIPKRSFIRIWTKDIENTRQRIIDGAGACCGSHCSKCRKTGGQSCEASACSSCQNGQCAVPQTSNDEIQTSQSKIRSLTSGLSSLLPSAQTAVPELPPTMEEETIVPKIQIELPQLAEKKIERKSQTTKRRFGLISGRTSGVDSPGPVEWRAAAKTSVEPSESGISKALEIFRR